jgi:hypothetical protein
VTDPTAAAHRLLAASRVFDEDRPVGAIAILDARARARSRSGADRFSREFTPSARLLAQRLRRRRAGVGRNGRLTGRPARGNRPSPAAALTPADRLIGDPAAQVTLRPRFGEERP